MPRQPRVDVGGEIYHCLNRAVGRQTIFRQESDYRLFEKTLQETVDVTGTDVLAYCVMPNHFHLVLHSKEDGEISGFMKQLTGTHTQRYRAITDTVGEGSVYQGRFKSYLVQGDNHLFTVLRYVERNPVSANIVVDPLEWKYSSAYRRYKGDSKQRQLLAAWPCEEPADYISLLAQPLTPTEVEKIEYSISKGVPFGNEKYIQQTAEKYGSRWTTRGKGRPRKQL